MRKTIQVTIISNPGKKEYWINPILTECFGQMCYQCGVADAPYNLISVPQMGYEVSQIGRNFASWRCIDGTKIGDKIVKPDFLMMLDADMAPMLPEMWAADRQQHIYELLHLVKTADEGGYPIFGALYPSFSDNEWFLHCYHKNRFMESLYESYTAKEMEEWIQSGEAIRQVDAIGTGVIVIRREVLESLQQRNRERGLVDPKTGRGVVFDRKRDAIGRTEHGEDLLFCTEAGKLGFGTYASCHFLMDHYHTVPLLEIPTLRMERGGPNSVDWSVEDYGLPKDWKLPEITQWSMTPGGCRILRELIKKDNWPYFEEDGGRIEPSWVLELGPGISSLAIFDELTKQEIDTRIIRQEHNEAYFKYMCSVEIGCMHTVLADGFYHEIQRHLANPGYGLIIVDGPPSHEGTRRPAMYKVWNHWTVGGYLVLDDAQREPEKTIVEEWKAFYGDRVSLEVKDDGYGRQLAVFRKVRE